MIIEIKVKNKPRGLFIKQEADGSRKIVQEISQDEMDAMIKRMANREIESE